MAISARLSTASGAAGAAAVVHSAKKSPRVPFAGDWFLCSAAKYQQIEFDLDERLGLVP